MEVTSKSKLWTKDFIILGLTNCFVALTFYLLMTSLAVYAMEQFQASESQAGFAAGIFIVGALFARLLTGKYIEVIGRRRLLIVGLALFFAATLLYYPIHELSLLLLVRFIHGTAFGAATTAMSTTVMSMIPNERRGEGTGYYSLSTTIATAIGPFLGLFITQHADIDLIFGFCTVFSFVSMIIILFVKIPEAGLTSNELAAMRKGFTVHDFFEKKVLPLSLMMIFMGIAYSGVISFINVYANEIQLTDAGGFFFVVYAIVLFVSRPFAGRMLDQKGDNIVIYPAILLFSISLLLLSQAAHGVILLLTAALMALGYGSLMSSAQAIAVKKTSRQRVGLAISTLFICMDAGMGIGPLLTGMLVPLVGYRGLYVVLSIIVLLCIVLYYFAHGRNAASTQQTLS